DIGNILDPRKDPVTQDRLAHETHVTEVVILRTDIERHIHVTADGLSFITNARTARGQRRPADVIATSPPRYPGRSPIQVFSRKPDPTVVREIGPATVVIGGPAEILVADPGPPVIGVRPVSVRVWTPVRVPHYDVRLPAVAVTFGVNPVPTGKIVINKIHRYARSPPLRNSRRNKSQHA